MPPDYDKKVPEFEKKVPESEKVPESDKKYLKKVGGHIDRNVVQITIKMRTIVRITLIILIGFTFLFTTPSARLGCDTRSIS